MSGPQRLLMAGGGAAPAFDPVTGFSWSHLWYVGGPEFLAQGNADGASVGTWPDEISTFNGTAPSSLPVYRAALAGFNNKPCLEFNTSQYYDTHAAGTASVAAPYTVILILNTTNVASARYIVDGKNDGSTGNRVVISAPGTGGVTTYGFNTTGGSGPSGGTVSTGIKAMRANLTTGASDVLTVNGSTVLTGQSGSATFNGFTIGGPSGVRFVGYMALLGVYSGDITAAGNWAAFVSWVSTQYGVTLS